MRPFKEIQDILGDLPEFPKIYLLGSTGAGKTTIVRNIIDTAKQKFPSVTQTRTTVASTEYVLSRNIPFKATIIFKSKEEIIQSVTEILEVAIQKGSLSHYRDEDRFEEVRSQLEETPDERFRLKYIINESFLDDYAKSIINTILPMTINRIDDNEDLLESPEIKSEIAHLKEGLLKEIIEKANGVCPDHDIFKNTPYILKKSNKDEFILSIKDLLKSEINSISPIIEYARIEGNLLADWLPDNLKLILIDGEGIGHDLKETRNSLSDRHLDFFSFSDAILLVEKSDDPFIAGGKSAIETIFLNGYSTKFKLLFTKLDKLEFKDKRRSLNTRIANVKNALSEQSIQFELDKSQKYYFEQLDKSATETSKREILRLLNSIKDQFAQDTDTLHVLEYDFDSLFINLNTKNFILLWDRRLSHEHWAIIKALTRRMVFKEGEYRYLKPVLEFQDLIMRQIHAFLQQSNSLDSSVYNAQNRLKQKISAKLLAYIRESLMDARVHDWAMALDESGIGSGKRRSNRIRDIYDSFVPDIEQAEQFKRFKTDIKDKLIESGAAELSRVTSVKLEEIKIKHLFGFKTISWQLSSDVNVLIGKNGTGKSSILRLIDAHFKGNKDQLEKHGNPQIKAVIKKEYENGTSNRFEITENARSQKIKIVNIDTFDKILAVKIVHEDIASPLDFQLKEVTTPFASYLLKLKNKHEEAIKAIDDQLKKLMTDMDSHTDFQNAKDLYQQKEEIKAKVFSKLTICQTIINDLFKDTDKSIDFLSSEKGDIIIRTDQNDDNDKNKIDISQLSSGEKQILIILLTVLLKEDTPYILLMDEPEISLHLDWQTSFIENIRKLNSDIQIIIATHNPLLVLNRNADEIGILENGSDVVVKKSIGSKYMDISATILSFFSLNALVGSEMKKNIEELFRLKEKESLSDSEQSRLSRLEEKLDGTLATNFIYDRHYYNFLKFIKKNKNIDFDKFTQISDEKMDELLGEYKDLF